MNNNKYINHFLIKKNTIEKRLYQLDIASKCLNVNSLIILPTSLGKTVITLLITVNCIEKKKGSVLILAPTKPLVEQHVSFFLEVLNIDPNKIIQITGHTPIIERVYDLDENKIIIATPQVIKNDILKKKININKIYYLIFDEVHHATGKYAYTFIANAFNSIKEKNFYIIGITASPGNNIQKIKNLKDLLNIKNVIYKTNEDFDIKKYIYDIIIKVEFVILSKYYK